MPKVQTLFADMIHVDKVPNQQPNEGSNKFQFADTTQEGYKSDRKIFVRHRGTCIQTCKLLPINQEQEQDPIKIYLLVQGGTTSMLNTFVNN